MFHSRLAELFVRVLDAPPKRPLERPYGPALPPRECADVIFAIEAFKYDIEQGKHGEETDKELNNAWAEIVDRTVDEILEATGTEAPKTRHKLGTKPHTKLFHALEVGNELRPEHLEHTSANLSRPRRMPRTASLSPQRQSHCVSRGVT